MSSTPHPPLTERSWEGSAPRAVLLHGSSSSSGSWWQVGPALADRGWSVRAIDLPGHGASPRLDREMTPEALADHVERSLPAQPLDLLVGHSLGALVALELVARAPERVRRLVLEEPPGPLSLDCATMAGELERNTSEARADLGTKLDEIRAGFPRWHDADCRQAAYDLVACDEVRGAAGLRRGSDWRTISLAAAATMPTLVLLAPRGRQHASRRRATRLPRRARRRRGSRARHRPLRASRRPGRLAGSGARGARATRLSS